jgi:hypothetical protein
MLEKLTEMEAQCLERAARCRARAEEASAPRDKQDYLEMAERWQTLAKSYSLTQRLKDFTSSRPTRLMRLVVIEPSQSAPGDDEITYQCGLAITKRSASPTDRA